jgi:peptidoglycan/LPS O-acetylase OafA/YrhL
MSKIFIFIFLIIKISIINYTKTLEENTKLDLIKTLKSIYKKENENNNYNFNPINILSKNYLNLDDKSSFISKKIFNDIKKFDLIKNSTNNTVYDQACINKTDELLQLIFDPENSNKTINDYLPFFLYSGSGVNQLGDYSACIEQNDYNYVLGFFGFGLKLGICFIKECKAEYLNKSKGKLISIINKQFHLNITESSITFSNPKDDMINYQEGLETGFYISITCLILFALLSIIGTLLIYNSKKANKTYSLPIKNSEDNENDKDSQSENDNKNISNNYNNRNKVKVNQNPYVTLREEEAEKKSQNEAKENLLINKYKYKDNDLNNNNKSKLNFFQNFFLPFDILKNVNSIFIVKNENKLMENMRVLDGVRFLSTCWVLWGHTFLILMSSPTNILNFTEIVKKSEFVILENAFVSVDVFFFLSGFLLYFTLIKYIKNLNGISDKIKFFFISLFQRYIRLFPLIFIASVFVIYIFAPFNNGPISQNFVLICDGCRKYWWANLLYIQTLINYNGGLMCVGHGWYLGDDMIFFIIMTIIILALSNKAFYFNLLIFVIFVYSNIWQIIECNNNNYTPSFIKQNSPNYFKDFYIFPLARINPYIMGIWYCQLLLETDLYLNEEKNKEKILIDRHSKNSNSDVISNSVQNSNFNNDYDFEEDSGVFKRFNRYLKKNTILCFIIFIFSLIEINYALFSVLFTNRYNTPQSFNTFCLVFNKIIFINGLGNILHLTYLGKLSFIKSFLSMEVFSILGKLTYSIYIFHYYIIMTWGINSDSSFRIDFILVTFLAMGLLAITIVFAFFMSVLFESPVINMLKTTKKIKG